MKKSSEVSKLSKLIVSYYVLIKKSIYLGHFCVTDKLTNSQTHRLTNSQTHRQTDGKCVLQSCMSQLKIFKGKLSYLIVSYYVLIKKSIFLGHICVTDSLTHRQTNGWKVWLTELHVTTKNRNRGKAYFCL